MPARKITVSAELCDGRTGEMQLTVADPGNPDPDFRYQDMVLHPAVCSVMIGVLNGYEADGIGAEQTISLNAGEASDG